MVLNCSNDEQIERHLGKVGVVLAATCAPEAKEKAADLLKKVAKRIGDGIREEDTIARLGGDEFVIMTWQDGLDGSFGSVITDSWFTDGGIDFDLHYNNVGGIGNLTIEAVPEPATLSLLGIGGLAIIRRQRS